MALPKNKKVSEYNRDELNEYCQMLFDKSGKPATRGPCKNWSEDKPLPISIYELKAILNKPENSDLLAELKSSPQEKMRKELQENLSWRDLWSEEDTHHKSVLESSFEVSTGFNTDQVRKAIGFLNGVDKSEEAESYYLEMLAEYEQFLEEEKDSHIENLSNEDLVKLYQNKISKQESEKPVVAYFNSENFPSKHHFENPNFKIPRGSNTGRQLDLRTTADNNKVGVYLTEEDSSELIKSYNVSKTNPDYTVFHYNTALVRKQRNKLDENRGKEVVIHIPTFRSQSDTQLINTVLSEEFAGRVKIDKSFLKDSRTGKKIEISANENINVSKFLEDCDKE